jgi:hypothetical protein
VGRTSNWESFTVSVEDGFQVRERATQKNLVMLIVSCDASRGDHYNLAHKVTPFGLVRLRDAFGFLFDNDDIFSQTRFASILT